MNILKAIIIAVIAVAFILLCLKIYFDNKKSKIYRNKTKFIVRVAIFSAISIILYTIPALKFPLPFFPSFLELHFDEIPILIAGFAYGPLSAIWIILIKALVKLPMTTTLCVGEFADVLCSLFFVIPASLIYQKKRTFKRALFGIIAGTILQIIVAMIANVYILIPFYMNVMEFSEEALLGLCQSVIPSIQNLKWSYAILAVLPFNALKDGIVVVITLIVYKTLHRFIDNLQN